MSLCCGTGSVQILESDIYDAVNQGILHPDQALPLGNKLKADSDERWRLSWVNTAYFVGGSLILGSMTWLLNQAWNSDALALFYLSSLYVAVFGISGYEVYINKFPKIPQIVGEIFTFIAVWIVPVSVWAMLKHLDFHFDNAPNLFEFLSLTSAGVFAIFFVRSPALTFPIAFGIFGVCVRDLPQILFTAPTRIDYAWLDVAFGVGMTVGAIVVQRLQTKLNSGSDFAFFFYFYGLITFGSGFSYLRYIPYKTSVTFEWIYLIVNLLLCTGTPLLNRILFVIVGGLGSSTAVVDFMVEVATVAENAWVSVLFGTIVIVAGYWAEKRNPSTSFTFWAYFFGASIFWSGWVELYGLVYKSMVFKFVFCLVNIGMCLMTLYLQARIFAIYGLFGVAGYISDMVYVYYWNSPYLPLLLTLMGLVFIALAVWLSKSSKMSRWFPSKQVQPSDIELQDHLLGAVYYQ